jgi:hypothetical protein
MAFLEIIIIKFKLSLDTTLSFPYRDSLTGMTGLAASTMSCQSLTYHQSLMPSADVNNAGNMYLGGIDILHRNIVGLDQ